MNIFPPLHPTSRHRSSSSTELRKANQFSSWSTTSSSRRTWVSKISPKSKKNISLFNRAVGEFATRSSWRRRGHARRLLLHWRRHCQLGGHLGLLVESILRLGRIGLNNFFAIYWKSESRCKVYFFIHIFEIVSCYVYFCGFYSFCLLSFLLSHSIMPYFAKS